MLVYYVIESLNQDECLKQSTPVCDVLSHQHTTLCSFLRTHEEFNYFGFCQVSIKSCNGCTKVIAKGCGTLILDKQTRKRCEYIMH